MDIAKIRSLTGKDDSELRELLRSFGWVAQLPAIVDEHGVVLVGHRRLRLAKELGIAPVMQTLRLGSGDAADAERLKPPSPRTLVVRREQADRQRIAEHLHGSKEWTMEKIAAR